MTQHSLQNSVISLSGECFWFVDITNGPPVNINQFQKYLAHFFHNNWNSLSGWEIHIFNFHFFEPPYCTVTCRRLPDEHLMLQNSRCGPAVYDSTKRFLNSQIWQSVCCSFVSALPVVSDCFRPRIGSCVPRDRSWQVNIYRSWCFLLIHEGPAIPYSTNTDEDGQHHTRFKTSVSDMYRQYEVSAS